MKNFFQAIAFLHSNKRASVFIIIFCIAAKSLLISFYTYTGRDKIYSLSASYNLLHGKGWTNSFYYLDNMDKEVLEPFCYWPPGYGLLISPLQKIFGTRIFLSTVLFEIICFIIFILLCRAILNILGGISIAWLNISTVLLTFFSHDFIENSLGTDLLALIFILGFLYCSILIWNVTQKRVSWYYGILAGVCLFFAGFTRYQYIPVSLLMAVVVLIMGLWKKNSLTTKGYFISLLICFTGLIAAMLFQQSACGSPFYTDISDKGIFWQNLIYWHPAFIASFIDLNLVPVQLNKYSSISYATWLAFFHWINLVFYLLLIIAFFCFIKQKRREQKDRFSLFIIIGFILSAIIIGELALLSLTHSAKYSLSGDAWTFIVEGRYQAFPVVFTQLVFLSIVARRKTLFTSHKPLFAFLSFLFILLLLNSIHQVYYTAKVAVNYRQMKTASIREQDYVYFESLLIKTIKAYPGKEILVASSDAYYPLLASMHGQKGIADPYKLNIYTPVVHRPSILFTIISAPQEKLYAGYVSKNQVTFIKKVAGTKIYMQLLNPLR